MWMINQINEDLNSPFELHFPAMATIQKWTFKRLTNLIIWGLSNRTKLFNATTVVTERIIEYPIVFSWLPEKGRILDIGCVSSALPIQLASMGFEVHGLDVRPYQYTHQKFTFHLADLFSWTTDMLFDTVYLISTLEHFGLGGYGDTKATDADHQVIQRIIHFLKPGGQLIVSVPFGKRGQTSKHRIYDMAQLKALFPNFSWVRQAYFRRTELDWFPASADELADVVSPPGVVNGVAIVDLRWDHHVQT
jgi:2-polyprenyl-3-methyl-5-hydroxy-6-metoxy-1,4-benzoquinol methylase